MRYSIVVPVFNEEKSILTLHVRLYKVLKDNCNEFQIIYVNDGSTDKSIDVLKEIRDKFTEVKIISYSQNYGKSVALFTGFKASEGDWIFTLDADLQNYPEDFVNFLKYKDYFDFIIGARIQRKDNFIRRFSSQIGRISRSILLGDNTQDAGCGLMLFRREIINSITFFINFHRFFAYLVRNAGFSVKEIPVSHSRRRFGKSRTRLFKRTIEGIFDIYGVLWLKKRNIIRLRGI